MIAEFPMIKVLKEKFKVEVDKFNIQVYILSVQVRTFHGQTIIEGIACNNRNQDAADRIPFLFFPVQSPTSALIQAGLCYQLANAILVYIIDSPQPKLTLGLFINDPDKQLNGNSPSSLYAPTPLPHGRTPTEARPSFDSVWGGGKSLAKVAAALTSFPTAVRASNNREGQSDN